MKKYDVSKLILFGSKARGDADDESLAMLNMFSETTCNSRDVLSRITKTKLWRFEHSYLKNNGHMNYYKQFDKSEFVLGCLWRIQRTRDYLY